MNAKSGRFVAGLLLLCLVLGCGQTEESEPPGRPVRTVRLGDAAALNERSLPGRASAAVEVNLSFRVSGPLVALPVEVGDVVKKGDLLATIDPIDFQVDVENSEGKLARAQANLEAMRAGARPEELEQLKAAVQKSKAGTELAESDFKRAAELIKTKTVSQAEYDEKLQARDHAAAELRQAEEALQIGVSGAREEDIRAKEAEVKSLQAALTAAGNQLAYTELKAPYSGTVAATYVENHEMVQAKQAILRLLDTSRIEFTIDVPESLIAMAPYAKDLVCTFREIPDREFAAEIKEIGIEASSTTRTYPVTLIMDNPDGAIYPGMAGNARGRAELPDEIVEEGFEVPESAVLIDEEDRKFVFVVDEAAMTVRKQEITLGEPTPRGLRIKGVEQEQLIATAGVHYLQEGQKVTILNETAKEVSP
ncbi:MAG: efflux RND transporter periplasmic adaptor subunit [Planctomycetes bacterium]|nr:efflux RND transporter periplasmic adaptor subunit [Planctomycetota bacterium]